MIYTKKTLVENKKDKLVSKNVHVFSHPEPLGTATSEMAWKILLALNEKPSYPNELSKRLKIHEQKVYYHINRMLKAGLIEIVKEEMRQGAVCKYFAPVSSAFAFELPGNESEMKTSGGKTSPLLRDFFQEFIHKGKLDGFVVVGAPTEHGPYLKLAKDGHFSAQLGMLLGSMCDADEFIVKLDTEIKNEQIEKNNNMIVIGGPITNMITNEINEKLTVKFNWKNGWSLEGKETTYAHDQDFIIAKIKNPWNPEKRIILLAGVKQEGTKTAIIAVTKFYEKILKTLDKNKDFYVIGRGLDRDGDGKIDDIKILD